MGLFGFLKKKENKKEDGQIVLTGDGLIDFISSNLENPTQENILKALDGLAKPDDDLEHLTKEGELPWGWHTHTKEFTTKISREYSYFLNMWVESRAKSPREQYAALKSFVVYLDDAEKLCKSKGECFDFWFREILTAEGYVEKRRSELADLMANLDELQANYTKRNHLLCDLDSRIIEAMIENPGILQSAFVKMFDPVIQNDVRERLYFWEKDGIIERTKSGRSYILHYKR